jgi:uncharacterized protein (TIGR03545 family)
MNRRLEELQDRWQNTVRQGRSDVDELAGSIEAVREIRAGSLDTVPELQQAVTDIRQAAESVNRVGEGLRETDRRIKEDRREIEEARRDFEQALAADVEYLASLADLSSGELKSLVSDLAAGYLEQRLGRVYGYVQRTRGYAQKLIAGKRQKREDRRQGNRLQRGVDVPFTATEYPRFLLQYAGVSVEDGEKALQGTLRNLSSNPDLLEEPLTFTFLQTEAQQRLGIEGALDSRQRREADLAVEVQAAGYTVRLSEGLEDLGLSSFSAAYRFRTDLHRSGSGDKAAGKGLLELYDLALQPAPGDNRLGGILYDTLGSLSEVEVAFEYTVESGRAARVTARSSADRQLARVLEARFSEVSAEYEDRIREALTARMAAQIRENELLSRGFADLVARSDGNLGDAAAYEEVLAQKRAEVEERIGDTREQATDAVKSQLESQLEKLPLPKLGF